MLKKLRQLILVLGDVVLSYASLFVAVKIGFWDEFSLQVLSKHILPFSILYFLWLIIFYIFGLYDLNLIKPKREFLTRISQAFLLCFGIGILLFYLVDLFGITPKSNLIINIAVLSLFIFLWRRIFYTLFCHLYLQKIAILGENDLAENLIELIKIDPQMGYKFHSFIDPKESLEKQIKNQKIDVLIISQDISQDKALTSQLYNILPLKIKIMDLAQAYETILQKIPVNFVNQLWFLENLRESEKKTYDNLKRLSDLVLSIILTIIAFPLCLVIAIIIKIEDNGPVFYKQERIGKNKKVFKLWKFRSMKIDAEKYGAKWAEKEDARVTKIGKIIRKWHLDELPQMINILRGDIALVGPRPERPEFVIQLEKEIPHYQMRHLIKSGFTGWAQIKFRYARSIEDSMEKFQYDLFYIKNRSFFLDLGILLKTFQLLFKREK